MCNESASFYLHGKIYGWPAWNFIKRIPNIAFTFQMTHIFNIDLEKNWFTWRSVDRSRDLFLALHSSTKSWMLISSLLKLTGSIMSSILVSLVLGWRASSNPLRILTWRASSKSKFRNPSAEGKALCRHSTRSVRASNELVNWPIIDCYSIFSHKPKNLFLSIEQNCKFLESCTL